MAEENNQGADQSQGTEQNQAQGTEQSTTDWRSGLPEDLQNSPALKDVGDVGSLAKQFVDLQKYQGQSIRIPSEDASTEDVQSFHQKLMDRVPGLMPTPDMENPDSLDSVYTRLGRPEDQSGYRVPEMDSQGMELDMSLVDRFRPVAHKVGLSQRQFETIVSEMTQDNVQIAQQAKQNHDQQVAELSREWGAAYNERVNKAIAVAESTGAPPALLEVIKNGRAGSNTMKWLYSLSNSLGGEGQNMVNQQGKATLAPDEAINRISEIRNNKEHPYWNPSDPAHQSARNKMRELHKLAYPGEADGVYATIG